jgi:hypothetical protein
MTIGPARIITGIVGKRQYHGLPNVGVTQPFLQTARPDANQVIGAECAHDGLVAELRPERIVGVVVDDRGAQFCPKSLNHSGWHESAFNDDYCVGLEPGDASRRISDERRGHERFSAEAAPREQDAISPEERSPTRHDRGVPFGAKRMSKRQAQRPGSRGR